MQIREVVTAMFRRAKDHLKLGRLLLAVFVLGLFVSNGAIAQQPAPASAGASEASQAARGSADVPHSLNAAGQNAGGHRNGSGSNAMDDGADNARHADKGAEQAGPPSRVRSKVDALKENRLGNSASAFGGRHHVPGPAGSGVSSVGGIDTSVSVQPARPSRKPTGESHPKKTETPHTLGVRDHRRTPEPSAIGGPARNAVGLAVDAPTKSLEPARQGVGAQGLAPHAFNGVAKNAIGSSAKVDALTHVPDTVHQSLSAALPKISINNSAINGTGMTRPGSGPGTVGGPARTLAGISGTGLRPKH
jgi:hypothetical protein